MYLRKSSLSVNEVQLNPGFQRIGENSMQPSRTVLGFLKAPKEFSFLQYLKKKNLLEYIALARNIEEAYIGIILVWVKTDLQSPSDTLNSERVI